MMNNLKQKDVGEESIIDEIKNELTKNICENITKEKRWKRNCPRCNRELFYSYKPGLLYAKKHNTCCEFCSKSTKNIPTNFLKLCTECETKMFFKTKIGLNKSILHNSKCRKCISKNFPSPMKYLNYTFSKSHREKIGIKSAELQTGQKYSDERVRHMVEGLVKMPYEEWILKSPESIRYTKKVQTVSRRNCRNNKLEHFGERGYNMDHIFPVKEAFKLNIPIEIISDMTNLRMIDALENRKKSSKIIEIPDIIKPYYETNSKS